MIGKLVGAVIGARSFGIGGPVGGVILGHALDEGLKVQIGKYLLKRKYIKAYQAQYNQIFLSHTFSLLGLLAKVDGSINSNEAKALESLRKDVFKLKGRQAKEAVHYFNRPVNSSLFPICVDLAKFFGSQVWVLDSIMDKLVYLAVCDGRLSAEEEKFLRNTAEVLGISLEKYSALFVPVQDIGQAKINHCYSVLGCKPGQSVDEIKAAFRKLVQQFHPDKLQGKDLSPEFLELAAEKFRSIQAAYDAVKHERGF